MSEKKEETALNKDDFDKLRQEALGFLVEAADQKGNPPWEFQSHLSENITVYVRPNESGIKMVAGKSRINATPNRVLEEVSNYENWKKWDSMLEDFKVIDIDDELAVLNLKISGIWPISGRDTSYLQVKTKLPDGSFTLCSRGLPENNPNFPPTDDFVRSDLVGGGWHIRPVENEPNKSDVTYWMNVDPKLSWLPNWGYNFLVVRFPSIINKVREGAEKK